MPTSDSPDICETLRLSEFENYYKLYQGIAWNKLWN